MNPILKYPGVKWAYITYNTLFDIIHIYIYIYNNISDFGIACCKYIGRLAKCQAVPIRLCAQERRGMLGWEGSQ